MGFICKLFGCKKREYNPLATENWEWKHNIRIRDGLENYCKRCNKNLYL